MESSRRKELSFGGGSGAGFIKSLVKTGKWSDGDQWVQETAGASDVLEEVMTRHWKRNVVSRVSYVIVVIPLQSLA